MCRKVNCSLKLYQNGSQTKCKAQLNKICKRIYKRKLMTTGQTEISHKTTKKFHGWSSGRWKCLLSADSINMNRQATGKRNNSRSWVCMQQSLFFKVREQLAGIRCLFSLSCWFQGSNSSSQVWLQVPMSSSSALSSCLYHEHLL